MEPLAEFITLLLPLIKDRLIDHLPQLMQLPSVLAHTVYSILEFDGVLRGLGYSGERREDKKDWEGIVEVLLGEKEVFTRWLEGERECRLFTLLSMRLLMNLQSLMDHIARLLVIKMPGLSFLKLISKVLLQMVEKWKVEECDLHILLSQLVN